MRIRFKIFVIFQTNEFGKKKENRLFVESYARAQRKLFGRDGKKKKKEQKKCRKTKLRALDELLRESN